MLGFGGRGDGDCVFLGENEREDHMANLWGEAVEDGGFNEVRGVVGW